MSLAESVALHSRHAAAPPGPGEADGAPAAASLRATLATGPGSPGEGAAGLSWLGAGGAPSEASWLLSATSARPAGGAGYAAAKASAAKAPAGPRITGEWSFLSDPSLSVEEKLARFMIAAQKKLDDDLTKRMEEYRARYGEGGTDAKKGDGDAIFGDLDGFLNDALKALGGPLLAALATAVGLPTLAPAALKVGDAVASAIAGGSSGAKKAGATKAGGTGKGAATPRKTTTSKEE